MIMWAIIINVYSVIFIDKTV